MHRQTGRRAARTLTRNLRLGRNLTGCTAVVMRLDPRVVIDLLRLKLSNDLETREFESRDCRRILTPHRKLSRVPKSDKWKRH